MFDDKKINEDLSAIFDGITKEMKSLIKLNGSFASGTLYNSIRNTVKKEGEDWAISFNMVYYGLMVDQGTRPGHYPNIADLREWARFKNISQDAVYPIAKNIFKYGTKARPFTTPLREGEQIVKSIMDEMGESFKDNLTEQIMRDAKFFKKRLL